MRRMVEEIHVGVVLPVSNRRVLPGEEGEVNLVLGMILPVGSRLRIAVQPKPDPDPRIAGLQDGGAAVLRRELVILPRLNEVVDEWVIVPLAHFVAERVN